MMLKLIDKILDKKEASLLVDGGLTENVPISALSRLWANYRIAINLNGNFSYGQPDNILDVATNAMHIAYEELIEAGHEQTQKHLKELLGG